MPVKTGCVLLIILLVAITVAPTVCDGGGESPARVLTLVRAFPANMSVELDVLKARDRVRHARILQDFAGGVVDFKVSGNSDPYSGGLYFTKVKLGSPPKEFNVQIDTGSDILWVTCSSCSDCPESSGVGLPLNFFDAASSSTASMVSCSNSICSSSIKVADASCSDEGDQCSYEFEYADESGTSGHYITDLIYFDMVVNPSMIANASAFVTFGCSTHQSGGLTKSDKGIDGIFGFGQHSLSVISQLSAQGITPKVFSHCLRGEGNGGGKLVLGEILDPTMVYTPIVPSPLHYNLELQSIAVGQQLLPIDTSAFATSYNQGTIVDTGTTLTYLAPQAYVPFVDAINAAVSQLVTPIVLKDSQCYLVKSRDSIPVIFPEVSFKFAGGASMIIKPETYLMPGDPIFLVDGGASWCIGFQKSSNGITVLGDLVLKDKIFVYDLSRQRIGWTDYDCSAEVNVSIKSYNNEFINGHLSDSISLTFTIFEVLLVHIIFWSLLW